MTHKRLFLITLLAASGLWLAARPSDILTDLHLTSKDIQAASFQAVTADNLTIPHLPFDARQWATSLSASARVQAVQALGQVVRAYTTTADFRNRYDAWLQNQYQVSKAQTQEADQAMHAPKVDAQQTRDQLLSQSTQAYTQLDPSMLAMVLQSQLESKQEELSTAEGDDKTRTQAEIAQLQKLQMLSRSNPAQFKKQYLAYINEEMNRKVNSELAKQEQYQVTEKQKATDYQKRLAQYRANANPNVALTRKLQDFIALTESIDFDAKVTQQGNQREFVNPTYRNKPKNWKLLYRMGREPVTAARMFAQNWLQVLR